MRERRVKGRRDWSVFLSEVGIEGRRIEECHGKGREEEVDDNSENNEYLTRVWKLERTNNSELGSRNRVGKGWK